MANVPSKPTIQNQEWVNGETKLNQTNLTAGVNQNMINLKNAVDGIIDALGGAGAVPVGALYLHTLKFYGVNSVYVISDSKTKFTSLADITIENPHIMKMYYKTTGQYAKYFLITLTYYGGPNYLRIGGFSCFNTDFGTFVDNTFTAIDDDTVTPI